tara:strand:- start:470 stop:940 length:471 start_codon:yes stop_codon:yes gene_type:complete
MFFKFKYHSNKFLVYLFIILVSCQFQEPTKNHGILFLENRSNQLKAEVNNKNDVVRLLGQPHTKSISNVDDWIYIERVMTKGSYHRLGQNVLKSSNVLVLTFDKYGVLKEKRFLNKNDIKKMTFSKKETENNLSKKSFVESFLSSVKTKMYGNRKK